MQHLSLIKDKEKMVKTQEEVGRLVGVHKKADSTMRLKIRDRANFCRENMEGILQVGSSREYS